MRRGVRVGVGLLVLVLGATDDAEARGRGGRGARSATIGTATVVSTGSIAAAAASAADPVLRPVRPVAPPAQAAPQEVRATGSWCATRRRVGTGTGFCLIN